MLTISQKQMEAFEEANFTRFKKALAVLLAIARPDVQAWEDAKLDHFLDQAIKGARIFGYTTKRQLALFTVLCYDYGQQFHQDKRFPNAAALLRDTGCQPLDRLDRVAVYLAQRCNSSSSKPSV